MSGLWFSAAAVGRWGGKSIAALWPVESEEVAIGDKAGSEIVKAEDSLAVWWGQTSNYFNMSNQN